MSFGLIVYFSAFIYKINKYVFTSNEPDINELASLMQVSLEKKDKEILYLHNQINSIKKILNNEIDSFVDNISDDDEPTNKYVFLRDSYDCLPGQMAMM